LYAVISDRSRQFTVRPGDQILCDLDAGAQAGETVTFSQVLVLGGEGSVRVGKPFLEGASVVGEVLGVQRGDKVVSMRFHRRKNVRVKRGHRQHYTSVRIQEIRG
jgi:large subunit ribosomal protein L21